MLLSSDQMRQPARERSLSIVHRPSPAQLFDQSLLSLLVHHNNASILPPSRSSLACLHVSCSRSDNGRNDTLHLAPATIPPTQYTQNSLRIVRHGRQNSPCLPSNLQCCSSTSISLSSRPSVLAHYKSLKSTSAFRHLHAVSRVRCQSTHEERDLHVLRFLG